MSRVSVALHESELLCFTHKSSNVYRPGTPTRYTLLLLCVKQRSFLYERHLFKVVRSVQKFSFFDRSHHPLVFPKKPPLENIQSKKSATLWQSWRTHRMLVRAKSICFFKRVSLARTIVWECWRRKKVEIVNQSVF